MGKQQSINNNGATYWFIFDIKPWRLPSSMPESAWRCLVRRRRLTIAVVFIGGDRRGRERCWLLLVSSLPISPNTCYICISLSQRRGGIAMEVEASAPPIRPGRLEDFLGMLIRSSAPSPPSVSVPEKGPSGGVRVDWWKNRFPSTTIVLCAVSQHTSSGQAQIQQLGFVYLEGSHEHFVLSFLHGLLWWLLLLLETRRDLCSGCRFAGAI